MIDAAGFDPMRDGLEWAMPVDAFPPTFLPQVVNLADIIDPP